MNSDRNPTQVIGLPSSSLTDPTAGLSKIKATALLLKQKVAGISTKPQKLPNKISQPWSLSSRAASFPPSASPSPSNGQLSKFSTAHGGGRARGSSMSSGGGGAANIKAMIAAREDPALSCNKMAPTGTQPAPAPQKRDAVREGMTKVLLSPSSQSQTQSLSQPHTNVPTATAPTDLSLPQDQKVPIEKLPSQTPTTTSTNSNSNNNSSSSNDNNDSNGSSSSADLGKRSTRRRKGGETLVPSQFAATTSTSSGASSDMPLFMKAFQQDQPNALSITTSTTLPYTNIDTDPNTTKTTEDADAVKNKNTTQDTPRCDSIRSPRSESTSNRSISSGLADALPVEQQQPRLSPNRSGASSPTSMVSPHAHSDTMEIKPKTPPSSISSIPTSTSTLTPTPTTPKTPSAATRALMSVFDQPRPIMSPRRHTTSSGSSSSSLFSSRHGSPPPLPSISQQQHMSIVNPALRQLQTPQIPTNLVQARIMQQEEQKRRDEELAKIPITANLRTVKKIQAVLVDEEEEEGGSVGRGGEGEGDENSRSGSVSGSSSASSSLSARTTRPRSKTATSNTVMVSMLVGGKQRGDRKHVEPVAIPKKLAEQVENILGRKLAGKGCVLDEREKEREEEEARKVAEPLPPIVRGQPRKRALTSAHIRNLVSSWDHKVEEAKEITSEAEQIRQFLEERSTAHAELPKFSKVPLSGSELLKPLPSLPAPPLTMPTLSSSKGEGQKKAGGHRHAKAASSSGAAVYMSSRNARSASGLVSPTWKKGEKKMEEEMAMTETDTPVPVVGRDLAESVKQSTVSSEMLETKRSGQVLDNKAVMSRPRRAGVRKPTAAIKEES
ncbi:hypothetical protein BC939DRAFT_501587 [Gamsiella multidivaricata]|uniref:uncharacterized protein n=1 Tax=Gamsiella multidivaricata TaxID=101098 RepID=UPI00221E9DE2|nr:uncharacterized protein BC939DRAFT_501587 [Gamsiella multidivaricata]KAG0367124.1 hypothetical protein BGZ54_004373 [Gamsiella multidivaricata]KAI7826931.1 hypothetical protein BC939DRAFT_501587 [Gamsiella multidivaricata]